jgi:hypothetical protein
MPVEEKEATPLNPWFDEVFRSGSLKSMEDNLPIDDVAERTGISVETTIDAKYLQGKSASAFEPALGSPDTTGFVLASTKDGSRFWTIQSGGAAVMSLLVAQSVHGFSVGDVVKCTGANTYAKAMADTAANAEVAGIVSAVANVDNFTLFMEGYWESSSVPAVDAGTVMFLSPTVAGSMTSTAPTTDGQISKPIGVIIENGAKMLVYNWRGVILGTWEFLGLEDLTDPGADRIFFWDESENATKWLACGDSIAITGTTLDTIQDIRTTAGPSFDHLHLTIADGTAPLVVTSTTEVANLNTHLLQGHHAADFAHADAKYIVQEANADLSAEQSLGALATGILKNTTTAGVGVLSIATGADIPAINANQVIIPSGLGTPTYDDVQDFLNETRSSGRITGGVIAAHNAGVDAKINISELEGMIFTGTTLGSTLIYFKKAVQHEISPTGITDGVVNWIYIDYDAGNLTYKATTARSNINDYSMFSIGRIWISGNTIEILLTGHNLYNKDRRSHNRLIEKYGGMDRVSGATLSKHGTALRIQADAGSWYVANKAYTTPLADTFFVWYRHETGAWTRTAALTLFSETITGGHTVYETYQIDTPAAEDLAALTANKYGVYWVFMCPDGHLNVVLGTAKYANVGEAQAATVPTYLPPYCINWARLIGRIICKNADAALYSAESSFSTQFTLSAAVDHASLSGLTVAGSHPQAAITGLTTADGPTFDHLHLTTDLPVSEGGTGASTFALNGILYGNAANAVGVTAIGAQYNVLTVGASPFVPAWSGYLLSGTSGGKTTFAVTGTKTLTLTATDDYNLTVAATASISGTNTGDNSANSLYDIGSDTQAWSAVLDTVTAGTYLGDDSITTLGTIATGGWHGTTIAADHGGTGATTLADGGLVIGNGTSAVEVVAAGATTQILVGGGAATAPVWGADIPTAVTIGTAYIYRASGTDVPVADGGTGASTLALNGVLYGNGTSAIGATAIGAEGRFLRVGASPFVPAWSTLTLPNTGTAYRLPVFSATNVMTELAAVGATGEYLAGNTGAIPSWANTSAFEPALGNPAVTGYVLSSTDAGVRSWIAAGGALALDDLTDVDAASPSDDDIIRFDTASGLWKHEALPAAGGGDFLVMQVFS